MIRSGESPQAAHERRADLLGVVEVELAAEADDASAAHGLDS